MRGRTRIRLLAALLPPLALAAAACADPCCLLQLCQDLDPMACVAQEGLVGHCRLGEACGNPACDGASIQEIEALRVRRTGALDLELRWLADPFADAYRVRLTGDPGELPTFRDGGGRPVPDADPTLIPEAPHPGVVGNGERCVFYQVDGLCLAPPDPTSACCWDDGSCTDERAGLCAALGGLDQGAGTDCASVACPQPGACCYPTRCEEGLLRTWCEGNGGVFVGEGTGCNPYPCPTGACCEADGSCSNGAEPVACDGRGGEYQGDGSDCLTATCPPLGACCLPTGCADTIASACATAGGIYMGDGSRCASDPCSTIGACCQGYHSESCDDGITEADCVGPLWGGYAGNGTSCATTDCSSLRGACCDLMGTPGFCQEVFLGFCQQNSGTWMGTGSTCAASC